jgi:hypothetical protein
MPTLERRSAVVVYLNSATEASDAHMSTRLCKMYKVAFIRSKSHKDQRCRSSSLRSRDVEGSQQQNVLGQREKAISERGCYYWNETKEVARKVIASHIRQERQICFRGTMLILPHL